MKSFIKDMPMKDVKTELYKGYLITSEEGIERGLFFRNPIQKVFLSVDYIIGYSLYEWLEKVNKNPIRKLFEILIGNLNIIKNIERDSEDINFAGYDCNILCSPIYFKRIYRKLIVNSTKEYLSIKSIKAYGYENPYETVAGFCEKETFKVTSNIKSKQKIVTKGQYHYTYPHIIKQIIDSDESVLEYVKADIEAINKVKEEQL